MLCSSSGQTPFASNSSLFHPSVGNLGDNIRIRTTFFPSQRHFHCIAVDIQHLPNITARLGEFVLILVLFHHSRHQWSSSLYIAPLVWYCSILNTFVFLKKKIVPILICSMRSQLLVISLLSALHISVQRILFHGFYLHFYLNPFKVWEITSFPMKSRKSHHGKQWVMLLFGNICLPTWLTWSEFLPKWALWSLKKCALFVIQMNIMTFCAYFEKTLSALVRMDSLRQDIHPVNLTFTRANHAGPAVGKTKSSNHLDFF